MNWHIFINTVIIIWACGAVIIAVFTQNKDFKEAFPSSKENNLAVGVFIAGSWYTIYVGRKSIITLIQQWFKSRKIVRDFRSNMKKQIAAAQTQEAKQKLQILLDDFNKKLKEKKDGTAK